MSENSDAITPKVYLGSLDSQLLDFEKKEMSKSLGFEKQNKFKAFGF